MGRSPCCAKEGLNRGAWTPLEDRILTDYIRSHGEGKWRSLPKRAGLKRCGKSCRLRWLNYLRPDIKRGNITDDEEDLIIRLHRLLGNRWSLIAGRLPGRTDNEIKNYWNTNILKKIRGGHATSSTKCKPPSKRSGLAGAVVQNLTTDQSMGPPNLENVGSCVVRTKARRCTKVFINADLRSTQQPGIMALKAPSTADAKHDFITSTNDKSVDLEPLSGGVSVSPTFSGEEDYYSSGFMMDFEMDDKFLIDFLNTDFVSLQHDFGEGVTQVTKTETNDDANDFSPNSSQNALLHDHSDLGSMASLLDPAMDWLHDDEYIM